mmetsp:Transcript_5152/g.11045  ORF Transcript_5152/g.11045 Transcript_5152/m.11045 type:complete len:209 (-) Transcript_5152:85-711(-)
MGNDQTKLHWAVLAQDWRRCMRRLEKSQGGEARSRNEFGDLPLHLACYDGQAPPAVIRALIDAYPGSVREENKKGRDPLELAAINYRRDHPARAQVLALLRWHRPGDSPLPVEEMNMFGEELFSNEPPANLFLASDVCVVCLERPSSVAVLPCGHVCLCLQCLPATMKKGICPVDRVEVTGLYRLPSTDERNLGVGIEAGSLSAVCCS